MKPKSVFFIRLVIFAGLSAVSPMANAALVDINFNGGTELADNFRRTNLSGLASVSVQSGGIVSTASTGTLKDNDSYIYDTTPVNNLVQSTFSGGTTTSVSIRAGGQISSFGIYIINPAEAASQLLVLFNWDVGNVVTNDTVRIFKQGALNGSSVSGQVGGTVTGSAGSSAGDGAFTTATLSYTQGANSSAIVNFTVGGITTGSVNLGNDTFLANYEIGLRSYDAVADGSGTTDFDNFLVVAVPEPSSMALLGLAFAGFFARRRR